MQTASRGLNQVHVAEGRPLESGEGQGEEKGDGDGLEEPRRGRPTAGLCARGAGALGWVFAGALWRLRAGQT